MVADILEASDACPSEVIVAPVGKSEDELDSTTWDQQVQGEKRIMEAATRLVREVRQSEVHRKLPHFYAVDRQLQLIEHQLEDIGVRVQTFWRYGRDSPMRELLELPMLQMVADGGKEALLPLSLPLEPCGELGAGHAAEGRQGGTPAPDGPEADADLLGVALGADKGTIESAYRRRSRHFHRCGRCCNLRGFHALTAARNRCLARVAGPSLPTYGTGGDLLAHYLLAGTDPTRSRYREYATGILDSKHRGHMLKHLQVLQWPTWDIPLTWGDEDVMVTYGGPNHMGSSG